MNGNVLERKDHTSVFCPQSLHYQYVLSIKIKVAKVIFSFVLIVLGIWLMTLTM
jgi:hypothetical protein